MSKLRVLNRLYVVCAAAVCLVLLGALALASAADAAPVGAQTAAKRVAKVVVSKVTVKGKKVTVAGRVSLPVNTARQRKRTRVALTLTSSTRKVERFTAKIDSKRKFKATKTTKLTGRLTVGALVRIAGKQSGKKLTKRFKGPAAAKAPPAKGGPGGNPVGPFIPPLGGPLDPPPAEQFDPEELEGEPLLGLFKLDPGNQAVSGAISGSYFKMMSTNPSTGIGAYVPNADSPFASNGYTPLRPGTDGGLSTVEYQPAPAPAFTDGTPGHSLANRIVLPQRFFNIDFSIATDPVARGTNSDGSLTIESAPLPLILNDDGVLSGQTIAWTAAWNGLWFTQGSPKPNGTFAANPAVVPPRWDDGGTTPLTGTYDEASGRFVLTWQSLIVGGPFDNFSGQWHLEGTFVPAP